jgi:hypothetical protein
MGILRFKAGACTVHVRLRYGFHRGMGLPRLWLACRVRVALDWGMNSFGEPECGHRGLRQQADPVEAVPAGVSDRYQGRCRNRSLTSQSPHPPL